MLHRRSQDFLWGVHFSWPKNRMTFFSRQRILHSHMHRILSPTSFLSRLRGCTSRNSAHFGLISTKNAYKNIFRRPGGGAPVPHAPLGYAYAGVWWYTLNNLDVIAVNMFVRRPLSSCVKPSSELLRLVTMTTVVKHHPCRITQVPFQLLDVHVLSQRLGRHELHLYTEPLTPQGLF